MKYPSDLMITNNSKDTSSKIQVFIIQKWGIIRLQFVLSLVNLTHKVADIATKNINHTQFFFNLFAFTVFLLALNKLIKILQRYTTSDTYIALNFQAFICFYNIWVFCNFLLTAGEAKPSCQLSKIAYAHARSGPRSCMQRLVNGGGSQGLQRQVCLKESRCNIL